MKKILLTQNKYTLVDDDDFIFLSQYKWHYKNGYAARAVGPAGRQVRIWMHRVIMLAPDGMDVDHINRDPLDNRKNNLRIATRKQNADNRGLFQNNKSGYTGVIFHKGKWQASYRHNGKLIYLGRYETPELAYKAYLSAKGKLTK